MNISLRTSAPLTILELEGDLDSSTAGEVQDAVETIMGDAASLVLDLARVEYMSSAGLRVLLLLYRQAQSRNTPVVLAGMTPPVREVLSATGFLGFFVTCESVVEAHGLVAAPEAAAAAAAAAAVADGREGVA